LSAHLTPAYYPGLASDKRVTQAKPDLLYGYHNGSRASPFTQPQLLAREFQDRYPGQQFVRATTQGLQFPFFALELKADAGTGGSLWVATNQCAGDAGACLNAAGRLNELLANTNQPLVDNLTYCLAMNNQMAQLYVSWKPDLLTYYMSEVRSYVLSRADEYVEFRRHVRNIVDWGKDKRLAQIRDALDVILEDGRKAASRAAKDDHPAPSDDGSGSGSGSARLSKRRKPSGSSRGGSKGSSNGGDPSYAGQV
jgi:hypothetical protein